MVKGQTREPGSRDTSQRRAIREALEAADRPLSAAEILAEGRVLAPGLGIATVYRTVKRMKEEGALRQVDLPGDAPRYEPSGKAHHHHFHCRVCQRVFEVPACPAGLQHLAPPGFAIETHEVILYGRCPACLAGARRHGRSGGRRR